MAKQKSPAEGRGYRFGTFQGVFTPSILTIIGVVLYLRFGWMLGHVGLAGSLALVAIGSAITFLTGLSISTLATNMRMKGGGAYFMLSRTLGLESGAALGLPLALSQAVGVSFYVAGFSEALTSSGLPIVSGWDPRVVGLATLAALALLSTWSADIALKSQYFIMGAIGLSLLSFFLGGTPAAAPTLPAEIPEPLGFWAVFAVFFPAVTGILSGLGMSGDLRDPGKSIPRGTIAAVLVGFLVYSSVPIVLHGMVQDPAWLRTDTMILQKCARWPFAILLGVWAATLSSAIGSFLCAPRVLQALARDRLLPAIFGRGHGETDTPRFASAICFLLAAVGIALGDINIIAPVLTLFNLSTYALLNAAAAAEELLANPSWRPTFRVKAIFPILGAIGCLCAMLLISPGWTAVAIAFEAFLYISVARRQLRVQWGDARTGLLAALVRFALRRLSSDEHAERNWRPNLLLFARLPVRDRRTLELARGIADRRGFVTLCAVLPEDERGIDRVTLREAVARIAESADLDLQTHFPSAPDPWIGVAEVLRTYGFGPLRPNTAVFGFPSPDHMTRFAGVVRLAVSRAYNLLIGSPAAAPDADGPLDVWWRGGGDNGLFMLALAVLLRRADAWKKRPLRMNMIVRRRSVEEGERQLREFLARARIDADVRVLAGGDTPFASVLAAHSADATLSLVGLRTPRADESDEAYGAYFADLAASLRDVPSPVFVLAAHDVDLQSVFS